MLAAVELEGDEDLMSATTAWSHRPRDGDWIAGYDDLSSHATGTSSSRKHSAACSGLSKLPHTT